MGKRSRACASCNKNLSAAFAVYRKTVMCLSCFQDEKEKRALLIWDLPDIVDIEPPLGYQGVIALTERQAQTYVEMAFLYTGFPGDMEH